MRITVGSGYNKSRAVVGRFAASCRVKHAFDSATSMLKDAKVQIAWRGGGAELRVPAAGISSAINCGMASFIVLGAIAAS